MTINAQKAILNSICWLQIQDANVPFSPNPKGALVEWDLAITEVSSELIDMSKKPVWEVLSFEKISAFP